MVLREHCVLGLWQQMKLPQSPTLAKSNLINSRNSLSSSISNVMCTNVQMQIFLMCTSMNTATYLCGQFVFMSNFSYRYQVSRLWKAGRGMFRLGISSPKGHCRLFIVKCTFGIYKYKGQFHQTNRMGILQKRAKGNRGHGFCGFCEILALGV